MATLRQLDRLFPPVPSTARPLASANHQARVLRAVIAAGPGAGPVVLGHGLVLEAWERDLLYREARSEDVRGEALTLLRARAAEWAVMDLLAGGPAGALAGSSEATALLLDRTLADIGGVLETLCCAHPDGLERIAVRLQDLYDRIPEQSLLLAGCHATTEDGAPALDEFLGDAEFELSDLHGTRHGLALVPAPEANPSDADPFEMEQEVPVAALSVWAMPVPSREEVLVRTAAALESLREATAPSPSAPEEVAASGPAIDDRPLNAPIASAPAAAVTVAVATAPVRADAERARPSAAPTHLPAPAPAGKSHALGIVLAVAAALTLVVAAALFAR